ncbi:probable G-protein coupled receptor 139 [Heterodontus francisci]|uniref:probable G-protein coupled receptor 139 n=1 Tax=Heterodontus francisci TaxID=7792 RepID=UPI00355B2733
MATADLLFIITEVILFRIGYYHSLRCFLHITPVCSVIIVLSRTATECSVWFTVTFSFDRFVAICCQKLKTKYCNEKTAGVVLVTTCILLCLENVPYYFVFEHGDIIDNVPLGCYLITAYFTEPRWVGFDRFDKILIPLLPFTLILFLNALTVRHIFVASRVRKGLRGERKGENCSDPEMESRRKSVILLFSISGSFILLWLVYVVQFLYYNITGRVPTDYSDSEHIFRRAGLMLRTLNCCTKTFIYGATQSNVTNPFSSFSNCLQPLSLLNTPSSSNISPLSSDCDKYAARPAEYFKHFLFLLANYSPINVNHQQNVGRCRRQYYQMALLSNNMLTDGARNA